MKVTKIGTIWCKSEKPFCRECIGPNCRSCYFEEEEIFDIVKEVKE